MDFWMELIKKVEESDIPKVRKELIISNLKDDDLRTQQGKELLKEFKENSGPKPKATGLAQTDSLSGGKSYPNLREIQPNSGRYLYIPESEINEKVQELSWQEVVIDGKGTGRFMQTGKSGKLSKLDSQKVILSAELAQKLGKELANLEQKNINLVDAESLESVILVHKQG